MISIEQTWEEMLRRTGRLIETDDVGTTPCSSTKDNLDFLTTGETTHSVVRDELGFKTEISEVLLDLTTDERAQETKTLSLTSINLNDLLLETTLDKLVTREPDVLR